jgi:hypothetical protein
MKHADFSLLGETFGPKFRLKESLVGKPIIPNKSRDGINIF